MRKPWGPGAFLALFLPSSTVLGIHLYLGSFNRFIADDFCSAYFAERLGLMRSVWFWYQNWFGTYSASIVDSILPLIGPRGIAFAVPVTLLLWAVVSVSAVSVLWPKEIQGKERVLASLALGTAIIYVTLLVSPNVPQSLYWWGGMRAYIPPLLFANFYIIIFQIFASRDRHPSSLMFWAMPSFLISLAAGGFSEVFIPVQVVFFTLIIGLGLVTRKFDVRSQTFVFLLAALAGALLALVIVVVAPGNSRRQTFFPESPDLLKIISISFSGYIAFLRELVNSPDKIAGLLGITLGATWLGLQIKTDRYPQGWHVFAILLAGFIFAFGCFPSSAYGMSDVPPARTLIIPANFLVAGVVISGVGLGQILAQQVKEVHENVVNASLGLMVLVLMMFSAWNSGQVLYASHEKYRQYAQHWDLTDIKIAEAKAAGKELVAIPVMDNWAGLDNPNDNSKFWVNYCYSKYYDINVVAQDTGQ